MQGFFENIYDVLFSPSQAMQRIANHKQIKQGLVAFLATELLLLIAVSSTVIAHSTSPILLYIFVIFTVINFATWFTASALINLTAECFGLDGNATGLLACLGFAVFPRAFLVPFWVLAGLCPANLRIILLAGGGISIMLWVLGLALQSVKNTYGISSFKSIAILATLLLMLLVGLSIIGLMCGAVLINTSKLLANINLFLGIT